MQTKHYKPKNYVAGGGTTESFVVTTKPPAKAGTPAMDSSKFLAAAIATPPARSKGSNYKLSRPQQRQRSNAIVFALY